MTKEQQAQLGVLANPKMSSQNWYTDASGDMYLADPETLIEVKDLKSTNIPNAKMKFEKDMSQFITGMDLLMSLKLTTLTLLHLNYHLSKQQT